MKMLKTYALSALVCCAIGAQAQTAENGKKVRRILFDREQVNVVYTDGSQQESVGCLTVKGSSEAMAVKDVSRNAGKKKDGALCDLQGRRIRSSSNTKGVLLKRENGQVKKIVKK